MPVTILKEEYRTKTLNMEGETVNTEELDTDTNLLIEMVEGNNSLSEEKKSAMLENLYKQLSANNSELFSVEEIWYHVALCTPNKLKETVDDKDVYVENVEGDGTVIRLHINNETADTYLWNDLIDNYDPDTTEHDPLLEPRWIKE